MCWRYKRKCIEEPPEGAFGFIYSIYDSDTKKYYIGKKYLFHTRKTKLSKKARIGTRKRVKIEKVDSGWNNYYGSNKELLEIIKERGHTEGIQREILKFCFDKISLSYWETYFLMTNEVLFSDHFFNGNILGKYYKTKIHK
jgi:hypothetical protein